MAAELYLQTPAGVDVAHITTVWDDVGIQTVGTYRVYNSGGTPPASVEIGAMTAVVTAPYTGATNAQGQEAVTEQWLEASPDNVNWTPIGGDMSDAGNVLAIAAPAASAFTTFYLRLNIPAGVATTGRYFIMMAIDFEP